MHFNSDVPELLDTLRIEKDDDYSFYDELIENKNVPMDNDDHLTLLDIY